MSSNIALSAGVRQNLLALQNTASNMSVVQEALATGKKVNTALDNPLNYFTSQSLSNRASDLGTLLDSIGQAVQTLNTASQGLTSLSTLVQSAKSIANQALQSPVGSVTYTQITGSAALPDKSQLAGTTAVTTGAALGTIAVAGVTKINGVATGITSATQGDTLVVSNGSTTVTFEYNTLGTTISGDVGFSSSATLLSGLQTAFGAANVTSPGAGVIQLETNSPSAFTTTYTATGSGSLASGGLLSYTQTSAVSGSTLTVTEGSTTATFRYTGSAGTASTAFGTFTDSLTLAAAINANTAINGAVTATTSSGNLTLTAASTVSITAGGVFATDFGFSTTTTADNYNAALSGVTGTLTIQVGTDAASTLTFGTGNGQISTATQLVSALNAVTDITGTVNSSNFFNLSPQSSAPVTLGGAAAVLSALGVTSGTISPSSTVVAANATRTNLQSQYNNLLIQINQLAGDSSYNGVNLLAGNNLKVVFNETNTSSLTIQSVNFNAAGLGLTAISGTGFQDNNNINNTLTTLNSALTTLRAQASTFGSNLTTVQTRQDFSTQLISTLQTGASNLVLADTNQEGASLLALQTRQQLAVTSLSLASQADQAILKVL